MFLGEDRKVIVISRPRKSFVVEVTQCLGTIYGPPLTIALA